MEQAYKAIDLFAGIGGIRLGFEQAFENRIEFVYSNEIDKFCCKTYKTNFGVNPEGDIRKAKISEIPDFDILLAGFPCQPFSLAGKKIGFKDTRGNLFFNIRDILKEKRPTAFFLENVKHLKHHDGGRTFAIMEEILVNQLNYHLYIKILDAVDFGLPQKRKRIYMVGFKDGCKFEFPEALEHDVKIKDILEEDVDVKYYLSQQYLNSLRNHRERHEKKGHGFGFEILDINSVANTIVVGGMGKERNLIRDNITYDYWKQGDDPLKKKNDEGVRKMTEREWARLQGFPDDFEFPVSMTQSYKQLANSVPVNVIRSLAQAIKDSLDNA